ncbi:protein tamozhennic [Lutzomyia longipalpis]|uniref:protein tamozhennic n=1 Tax=Lutzomyia longipalpis TaxID=7200 RepID=UPI002484690F|nr:protein tamozhennic [Lutzomyia longipalpis]XP_055687360.1 protein tamozhennic [Lutzomyia longipalpis]
MSEMLSCNLLPDLWQQILQQHWTYLETEESLQKIEERQKLEECLKDFLCLVPHSRKFLLPVTAYVLQKSILQADDSSAYKASIGFESISQYANNLFTKPWRKEYRVIKMYSGFYYHEIQSNLVESEKIFEAMGYKILPNRTLILDGPICPDQVTNVSRDALAAFVECQILKQIFSGLTAMQVSSNWVDIFNFRSVHTGTPEQMINSMVFSMQEKRAHQEKQESYYSVPAPNPCSSCNVSRQYQMVAPPPPVSTYCPATVAPPCSLHPVPMANYGPYQTPGQGVYMPPHAMAHSKSLEHPSEKIRQPRHYSLDQPSYDYGRSPGGGYYDAVGNYDCVDGFVPSCAASFSAYNTAGNRYPLPGGFPLGTLNQPCESMVNGQHLAPPIVINGGTYGHRNSVPQGGCYHKSDHTCYSEYQGCNFCGEKRSKGMIKSENLIDLGDYRDSYQQPPSHDSTSMSNGELSDYYHRIKMAQKMRPRPSEGEVYARNNIRTSKTSSSRHNVEPDEVSSSDVDRHKNHDGVGSFETWDYVFQNLEKQGYTKDLGERDLLMQGLDLGSMKIHDDRRQGSVVPAVAHKVKIAKAEPTTKAIQTESVQRRSTPCARVSANNNNVGETIERQKMHQENTKNRQIQEQQRKTVRNGETSGVASVPQNEWSCRFCTYLNPDSRKICEMCSKSKDFFFSQDKTPTCV